MSMEKPTTEELRKGKWTIADEIMGLPAQYRPTTERDLEPAELGDDAGDED